MKSYVLELEEGEERWEWYVNVSQGLDGEGAADSGKNTTWAGALLEGVASLNTIRDSE